MTGMSLSDRIVVWVERRKEGWVVTTQDGTEYGPFESEYDLAQDERIGQRAKNWLAAQGGRSAPRLQGDTAR